MERSTRTNLPAPRRTASASMSAVHASPAIGKVACDHAQRLKPCAIAPVTPLRACAFAAIAGRDSGGSPGMVSCPSFHCAVSHCLALGSFGFMPHNSSAAGQSPKRNMTRAASAAACVPTCAPLEAAVAELIEGTQRGLCARRVLRLLIHGEGVAGGHEIERAECVDLLQRDFVSDATQMRCNPIGQRCPDAVAHLGAVAIDGNPTVGVDLDRSQASSPLRCHSSW